MSALQNHYPKPDYASYEMLTEVDAAKKLNIAIKTLQGWRLKGGGPNFCKFGRSVRYRTTDIENWISSNIHQHTA